jgi:hypothetical protein
MAGNLGHRCVAAHRIAKRFHEVSSEQGMPPNGSAFSGVRRCAAAAGDAWDSAILPRSFEVQLKHVRCNGMLDRETARPRAPTRRGPRSGPPCERPPRTDPPV